MGWKLMGIKTAFSNFAEGSLFGSNVVATYRLGYAPSMGSFKEMPRLDWHETIMMNDHGEGETWVFDTNMYTHNPTSKTLEVWPKRYIVAYDAAGGQGAPIKGYCKLLSKTGAPVKAAELDKAKDDAGKADAVRKYLKSKGGILELQIHDIPSINKPEKGERKERLLLFNVGVEGGGAKVKAYQYLDVDGDKPAGQWVRKAGTGWAVSGLKTTGLKKVAPPSLVSAPRGANFVTGECW
jgi:insecticidal toxin complex protein TccC